MHGVMQAHILQLPSALAGNLQAEQEQKGQLIGVPTHMDGSSRSAGQQQHGEVNCAGIYSMKMRVQACGLYIALSLSEGMTAPHKRWQP